MAAVMQTPAEQTRAFLYAIGVHLIAGFIMFAGLLFSTEPKVVVPRGVLEAVMVDMTVGKPKPKPVTKPQPPKPAATPQPKPVEPAKPEQAKPEPVPEPPVAKPDDVTDNKPIVPIVPDQEALNFERQREELRKQQEEARRQQELEQQRVQQLADIRKQRAAAEAERERAERALADVQDRQEDSPPPTPDEPEGEELQGADVEDSLLGQYSALINQVVTQNWRRPANTPPGIKCELVVRQIPGGEVIGVSVGAFCNADPLTRQSIQDAVERASPLPYDGFESVFDSRLNFTFTYNG